MRPVMMRLALLGACVVHLGACNRDPLSSPTDLGGDANLSIFQLAPDRQISGASIEIHGNGIRDPAIAPNAVASTSRVTFLKGNFSKSVAAEARPDFVCTNGACRYQVLSVVVPDRSGTDWSRSEVVTVRTEYLSLSVDKPFTYDDP